MAPEVRSDGAPSGREHPGHGLEVLPRVARTAIEARLAVDGRAADLPLARGALARRAGVFVTLRAVGALRGCIGTVEPVHRDLVAEVADCAVAAAFADPRFLPLTADELPGCAIEVSVLGALELVASEVDLDPEVFGVEVRDAAGHRGVLLPGLDGVDSVARQLAIARRKARIAPWQPVTIRRFRVLKYAETEPF